MTFIHCFYRLRKAFFEPNVHRNSSEFRKAIANGFIIFSKNIFTQFHNTRFTALILQILYKWTFKRFISVVGTGSVSQLYFVLSRSSILTNKCLLFRLPFDWKTPKGYLIAFIAQAIAICYYVAISNMILLLFGGLSTFSLAFISDIQICLNDLNNDVVTNKQGSSNLLEMKMKFRDLLEFHAEATQLSLFQKKKIQFSSPLCLIVSSTDSFGISREPFLN